MFSLKPSAKFFRLRSRRSKLITGISLAAFLIVVGGLYFYLFQFRAPRDFPDSIVIAIPDGANLTDIAAKLEHDHIIRSPFWFSNFVITFERGGKIVGGDYYFERPMNSYQIAKRLTRGVFNTDQIKTTIPEGSSIFDIAKIVKKNYPSFDQEKFLALAKDREGFLFPDTYIFGVDVKPETVISSMTSTFNSKIQQLEVQEAIKSFGKPLQEVITMASILEGEARKMKTRQIIAGILWERIRRDMPLQVDVSFQYVNGKSTFNLTMDDLKIDSPYNTYLYKGLPPTPISNPGLDSIIAAATPIKTNYLYFLTGLDGNMYYAQTYREHSANVDKYLR